MLAVEDHIRITEGLTLRVKAIRRQAGLSVSGNGRGLVSRAGTGLVVEAACHLGREQTLATATAGVRPLAVHTPAAVLGDLAVMLADGGTRLRHLTCCAPSRACSARSPRSRPRIERSQRSPTMTRSVARSACWMSPVRRCVHGPGSFGAVPAPVTAAAAGEDAGPLCIDLDATLVVAHSDDLRKGNAGANNATDQIVMGDRALTQLPELSDELEVLIRADTAGAVHGLVDHIVAQGCRFSVGMRLQGHIRQTRPSTSTPWTNTTAAGTP
jgi:hypothetical protein